MSDFDIEIDRYMLDCAAKGLSPKTMKSYEQTLKIFARYMDDTFKILSHKEVTAEHLRAYMRSLSERGKYEVTAALKSVTQTTIANYTWNIKAFYSHLHKEKVVRKNPMKTVQNVKPERKAKIMLEDNELKQFFRAFLCFQICPV